VGIVHGHQHNYRHHHHTDDDDDKPKVHLLKSQKPVYLPDINGSSLLDAFSGRRIIEWICPQDPNVDRFDTTQFK